MGPVQLSETAATRLEREVRLTRQLNHPHICRLYEVRARRHVCPNAASRA